MSATVNVNGRITGDRDAVVSVFDHGLLYGEGIYETLRTYRGRPFLYERHMRRLRNSARLITLALPFSDADMATQIEDTMAAADLEGGEAHIRVMVTRGVGELSYDLRATPVPTVIIIVKPHVDPAPDVYEQGVGVVIVDVVRNHPGSVNPMIKSNNLMNSALAAQEAIRRGGFEGIMRNYQGELSECSTANLFVVKDGAALTPPLASGLLPGITRDFVFDIGRTIGVHVREVVLRDDDLFSADEAFLTSTTREAVPIVTVDNRAIGNGRPGPITQALLTEFRRHAEADQPSI
jgi:branched-chain amino acid aminotransferase